MPPPSAPNEFPTSVMFDTLVKITVGSDSQRRTFEIFKGVLRFFSGYFNAALNGRFVEDQECHVKLPTENPKIFELFRMWIHTRRFYESTMAPSQLLPFDMLASLWVFADAHDVPLLQNVVADLIVEKIKDSKEFPAQAVFTYVHHNTLESSKLHCLLTDVFRTLTGQGLGWETSTLDDDDEHQSSATLACPMKFKNLRLSELQCAYHVHADGVRCKES